MDQHEVEAIIAAVRAQLEGGPWTRGRDWHTIELVDGSEPPTLRVAWRATNKYGVEQEGEEFYELAEQGYGTTPEKVAGLIEIDFL